MKVWRQGDVYICQVRRLPEGLRKHPGKTLFTGELTGHSHRFEKEAAVVMFLADSDEPSRPGAVLFAEVTAEARVVHEEHGTITLAPGCYRIWQQREYTPRDIRVVAD
jgi:hypothetical protein